MSRIPVSKNALPVIPDDRENFADIRFPVLGTDVSEELENQRDGTTPLGHNVRASEVLTKRLRGGMRCGLTKFINEQVAAIPPTSPQAIQNLTMVIDPSGTLIPFPFDDIAGEFFQNTDLDFSNNGRGTLIDGSIGDVYDGGSGFATNQQARPKPKVTITPNNQTKPPGQTFTWAGTEFTVDNGITNYRTYLQTQVDAAQAALDSRTAAEGKALTAYNDDPTDATLAYYNACVLATIKATAKASQAQALKDRADAAVVNTITMTSTGSDPDAEVGTYPIKGKDAVGVNLDLFRLKFLTGTLTVGGIEFVQVAFGDTFFSPITTGNLIVVVASATNTGADPSITSVTDSLGNNYTLAVTKQQNDQEGSGRRIAAIWYCISDFTGVATITVNGTDATGVLLAEEFSGIAAVSPVHATANASGTGPGDSTQPWSLGSVTASSGEMILYYTLSGDTLTQSYDFIDAFSNAFLATGSSPLSGTARLVGGIDSWIAVAASFKKG